MRIARSQLVKVFNQFLQNKKNLLVNPLPVFLTDQGGEILMRRLEMCLKNPEWSYMYKKGELLVEPLIIRTEPYLKKGIVITGLNYRLTDKDIPELLEIYKEIFLQD